MLLKKSNFHAKDIYSKWKQAIEQATSSVFVVSPYVDSTVKTLILSTKSNQAISRRIYTRIDSETIFDKPYQLKALIDCHKADIEVFQIDELHAKILIVDKARISIGSQNFTKRGRKNKETSFISDEDFSNTEFLKNVDLWLKNAKKIELAYLEELYKKLKKFIPKIDKLRKEHEVEFEKIIGQFEKKHIEQMKKILEEQRNKSLIKFASGYAYLTKNYTNNGLTLLADEHTDLTLWKSDSYDLIDLARLSWYPMIIAETGKLIFVRLGSTRITFYATGVKYNKFIKIQERYYFPKIIFNQDLSDKCNLEVQLDYMNYNIKENPLKIRRKQTIKFFFDGNKCEFLSSEYSDDENKVILEDYFFHAENLENFLKTYFKAVELKGYENNIVLYFKSGYRFKLYTIEFLGNPFIVCETTR
jgi:hypothetical protein